MSQVAVPGFTTTITKNLLAVISQNQKEKELFLELKTQIPTMSKSQLHYNILINVMILGYLLNIWVQQYGSAGLGIQTT